MRRRRERTRTEEDFRRIIEFDCRILMALARALLGKLGRNFPPTLAEIGF